MGDRCYLKLEIHGHIDTTKKLNDIGEALIAENFDQLSMEDEEVAFGEFYDEIDRALENDDEPYFEIQECNYGNVEDAENALAELNMSYRVYNDAGGSYGAGVASYFAVTDTRYEASMSVGDNEVVIQVEAIRKAIGEGMSAVVKLLDDADKADGNGLPNFTVSAEVTEFLAKRDALKALGVKDEPAAA